MMRTVEETRHYKIAKKIHLTWIQRRLNDSFNSVLHRKVWARARWTGRESSGCLYSRIIGNHVGRMGMRDLVRAWTGNERKRREIGRSRNGDENKTSSWFEIFNKMSPLDKPLQWPSQYIQTKETGRKTKSYDDNARKTTVSEKRERINSEIGSSNVPKTMKMFVIRRTTAEPDV
jgi:hypothetical protein